MTRSVRKPGVVTALIFGCLACAGPQPGAAPLVIRDVTVIDVETGATRPGLSLLIRDGHIAEVAASVIAPRGARVIDGGGKYLIPGLWDMHVHSADVGARALERYVRFGVTGVRDAGGSLDSIAVWRREIDAGRILGPRIVAAGFVLESGPWLTRLPQIDSMVEADGVPTLSFRSAIERLPVVDQATARDAVDTALARSGAFVKGRTWADSGSFLAIARRARERGADFIGHAPPADVPWTEAARAGMTGVEHMGGSYRAAFGKMSPEARQAAFEALARAPLVLDPNLAGEVVRGMADSAVERILADTLGRDHPAMRDLPPRLLEVFRRDLAIRQLEARTYPMPDQAARYRQEVALLAEAYRAGVPIVTGTDVQSLLIFPGWSLHTELELLVRDVGMSPLDALRAATVIPVRTLHLEASLGPIAPGRAADLVLLSANPLENIGNTRTIVAVVAAGRLVVDPGPVSP